MKVWYTTSFIGHYPVGVCAIAVADTQFEAYKLIWKELQQAGLENSQLVNFKLVFLPKHVKAVPTKKPMASIVLDGDY